LTPVKKSYDTQIKIRRIPAIFPEEKYKDKQTKEYWHFFFNGSSKKTRKRNSILQTSLMIFALIIVKVQHEFNV